MVENPTHLRNAVAQTAIGKKAMVKFIRDKGVRSVEVAIVEQPKTVAEAGSEESGESQASPGYRRSPTTFRPIRYERIGRFDFSPAAPVGSCYAVALNILCIVDSSPTE